MIFYYRLPPKILQIMIIKMQPGEQEPSQHRSISRKIRCPEHDQIYVFKCQYPTCETPFICSSLSCIEDHYHEDKITMTKFNIKQLAKKFCEVENMMHDDTIEQNARVMKAHIDDLKEQIRSVYTEIKKVNQSYDHLKGNLDGPLNLEYIQKVQENYSLAHALRTSVENLKQNVKVQFALKDSYFSMRNNLIEFLSENIDHFSWTKCREIFSSRNELINCQKFHQKLTGLTNLLFIFVGQTRIVGSYFSCSYPNLASRSKKDQNSFIFINKNGGKSNEFLKYFASEQAQQHISISEKTYICQGNTPSYGDGIRTFHKNFDALEFCLPTNTYKCEDENEETQSGTLKVKRFMILQFPEQKQIDQTE